MIGHTHTWRYVAGSYDPLKGRIVERRRCDVCGKRERHSYTEPALVIPPAPGARQREPKHWTSIVGSALFVLIAVVLYALFALATIWGISDYYGPPPPHPSLRN